MIQEQPRSRKFFNAKKNGKVATEFDVIRVSADTTVLAKPEKQAATALAERALRMAAGWLMEFRRSTATPLAHPRDLGLACRCRKLRRAGQPASRSAGNPPERSCEGLQEQERNRSDVPTPTASIPRQLPSTDPHHAADSLFPQVSASFGQDWGSRGRRFKSCRPDGRRRPARPGQMPRSAGLSHARRRSPSIVHSGPKTC